MDYDIFMWPVDRSIEHFKMFCLGYKKRIKFDWGICFLIFIYLKFSKKNTQLDPILSGSRICL